MGMIEYDKSMIGYDTLQYRILGTPTPLQVLHPIPANPVPFHPVPIPSFTRWHPIEACYDIMGVGYLISCKLFLNDGAP